MPDEIAKQSSPPELTDAQRGKFLDVIRTKKADGVLIGYVDALREAGVQGHKRDLKKLLDEDLKAEAREARGWSLAKLEACTWEVGTSIDHPAWDRANARLLKAYHPAFQDNARLEITGDGGGPIEIVKREVSLTGVLHVLAEAGALPEGLAGPLQHLAAARDVLPAQPD